MAREKTTPGNTAPPITPIVNAEPYKIEEYSPDEVNEMIRSKYPNGAEFEFTNITLRRVIPGQKPIFMHRYNDLPGEDQIQKDFGGGDYKLFIQWKPAGGSWREREYWVQDISIGGPPKEFTAESSGPGLQPAGDLEDPEMKFLNKLKLYKELGLIGSPGAPSGSSDTVAAAALKANADLMSKFMEISNKKPEPDPIASAAIQSLITKGIEKSTASEFDTYLKIATGINKITPGAASPAPDDSLSGTVKEWLPVLPEILKLFNNRGPGPLDPNAPLQLPANSPVNVPQRPVNAPDPVAAAINTLAQRLDQGFNNLDKRIRAIELEDDPEQPGNQLENVQIQPTEQEIKEGMQQGAILKASPMNIKVMLYKQYREHNAQLDIFNWCMQYKAVDSLAEFNEIAIAAGEKPLEGFPAPVPQQAAEQIPPQ